MYIYNFIFISIFGFNSLYAGNVQESREARLSQYTKVTEVQGVKPEHVTKASNGNIYIKNARVYSGSKESPDGKVSVTTDSNTRKVVLKNVKIYSKNNVSHTNEATNAVLSIETSANTRVSIENSDIRSQNIELKNSSNENKVCAGVFCIQAEKNSNIVIKNTTITASSTNAVVSSIQNKGKKCAGVFCVQADDSDIEISDTTVSSYGNNNFEIED